MASPQYFIRSKMHDYVLDVEGGKTQPGTKVILYPKKNPPAKNQLWTLEDAGDGYVHIVSALTGMVLDIQSGSRQAGALVIKWHRKQGRPADTANQRWQIKGDMIISAMHGMVLDIQGASRNPSTPLIVWHNKSSENQQWAFDRSK